MAIAAAGAAAAGAGRDLGVDDSFMKDLGSKMPEGGAAVFALAQEATRDEVVPEISKHGGHVIQSSLSDEQESGLGGARQPRGYGLAAAVLHITYVGHATVLIDHGGVRLLTDPVLRTRVVHVLLARRRARRPIEGRRAPTANAMAL